MTLNRGRINARVDSDVASRLEYVRARTGKSITEVLREAVELYFESITSSPSPGGILADTGFIGCGDNASKTSRQPNDEARLAPSAEKRSRRRR
jgi:Ribbon-helix-helix protein, copG family